MHWQTFLKDADARQPQQKTKYHSLDELINIARMRCDAVLIKRSRSILTYHAFDNAWQCSAQAGPNLAPCNTVPPPSQEVRRTETTTCPLSLITHFLIDPSPTSVDTPSWAMRVYLKTAGGQEG